MCLRRLDSLFAELFVRARIEYSYLASVVSAWTATRTQLGLCDDDALTDKTVQELFDSSVEAMCDFL